MSTAEYRAYLLRKYVSKGQLTGTIQTKPLPIPDAGPEKDLKAKILDEISRRGWEVFHGQANKPSRRTPGEPDLHVYGMNRYWLIELKAEDGEQSPPQRLLMDRLKALGHTVHVVRSLEEFLGVVG